MPRITCCVPGCQSFKTSHGAEETSNLRFHRLGKVNDSNRSKAWLIAIKRYDLLDAPVRSLVNHYVCSLHFEERMYAVRYLTKYAIPTLNVPTDYDCKDSLKTLLSLVRNKNTAIKGDKEVQAEETTIRATQVVIKLEPPEPSEMTIEQEQIGNFANSSVEDSVNILKPKVESMDIDDKICDESTMDETHNYYEGEATTNSIKVENIEESTSQVEHKIMHQSVPSKRKLKKLMQYTKKKIKINKMNKKEAYEGEATTNSIKVENIKESTSQVEHKIMHQPIPRKRKLKKLMQYTKKKINKMNKKEAWKRFFLGCDIYLTPQLSSIVKKHLDSKGNEFTNEYKMFCLSLYISSPTTYKFLSQVLCLPSKNDLTKLYFPIDSKINKEVLGILSVLANKMSPLEKECVLTLGEIKLKRSIFYDAKADRVFGLHEINGRQLSCAGCYAYTLMLRGVATDWKLLVGFSFSLQNKWNIGLNNWLEETLAQLFQMGYKVRAVCCPILPMTTQLLNKTADLQKKSHLEVDGKKVHFIFDIRRILIKARNALRAKIVMKDDIASWTCVKQLYEVDNKMLAPQLTKKHIKLSKHNLNELRYASEVLDSSVAIALNVYAKKRDLNPLSGTIQFIQTMSSVFEALNSDKPITCSDEEKLLFNKAQVMLKSLVVVSNKKKVEDQIYFNDALSITLHSISQIGDDMQSENLVIRRPKLTHSCMKSFYDAVRQLSGHSRRVTCREYIRAFRRCFLFHALRIAEKKDTSLTNNAAFLAEYEEYVRSNKIYQTPKRKLTKVKLPVFLYTTGDDRFITACSYILQKCVEKHVCPKLIKYVSSLVTPLKPGESRTAGLRVPPDHFIRYCKNLENYLQYSFSRMIEYNIFTVIKKKVKRNLFFDQPCDCFPVDFLLDMFIKIHFNNMVRNTTSYKLMYNKS